jgi:hypothetical protein
MATFKDLCMDSTDPRLVASFWGPALGLTPEHQDNGDVALRASRPAEQLWINSVSEPKTVKNRVHLDLHAVSVEALEKLGATVRPEQDDADRWTVMLDPEGNELCAFVREPERVPAYPVYELVVDSVDRVAIGQWWADVFGVELKQEDGNDWTWLEGVPGMPFEAWVFGDVPEPKTVKNRIHWDVDVASTAAIDELVDRGATVLRRPDEHVSWTVMADPWGNEFCAFLPRDMA